MFNTLINVFEKKLKNVFILYIPNSTSPKCIKRLGIYHFKPCSIKISKTYTNKIYKYFSLLHYRNINGSRTKLSEFKREITLLN